MKQAVPAQNEDKKVQNFVAQPPKPVAPATQPRKIAIVEKAMKKAHRPVWRPVGPMAVPTFSNKLPLAMKRGRNRRPGTSSSSTVGSRVLKLAVHAEEEDSVSELSDGNGSNAAVEDDGPIQLHDDLLLQ